MTAIALITGGSRGLGRNAAVALAKAGVDSIITYHSNAQAADEVVNEVHALGAKAVALPLDASDTSSFNTFFDQVKQALANHWEAKHFNYLVNNAGFGLHKSFMETTESEFDALMNVHVKGPYFLTQTLMPLMAEKGAVLNISSGLARFSLPGSSAYAMMKGAVEVMSRYMAKELGERGIRVNTLAPGAIETDFNGGAVRDTPQLNQFVAQQTALGRVGQADDIGGCIAALLDEKTAWVNGQRIEASGGMFL